MKRLPGHLHVDYLNNNKCSTCQHKKSLEGRSHVVLYSMLYDCSRIARRRHGKYHSPASNIHLGTLGTDSSVSRAGILERRFSKSQQHGHGW